MKNSKTFNDKNDYFDIKDNQKPLYSLSIKEFAELTQKLNTKIIKDILENLKTSFSQQSENIDICQIEGVMKLTGMAKATIYSKISRKEIPYISRGKPLLFSKKGILHWMYDGQPPITEEYLEKLKQIRENET